MLSDSDKQAMKKTIQGNQQCVMVLSMDAMDEITTELAARKDTAPKITWDSIRNEAELVANYGATGADATKLGRLMKDLGGFGRAYVKTYQGQKYIILKGYAGLRKKLTGTRYMINNAKVLAMGLGKHAAQAAARTGGIFTVAFLGSFRVADHFIRDTATLTELAGTLATDIVKVGITVGASLATASLFAMTGVAIGPIAAVVAVGAFVSLGLNILDEKYQLTELVIKGLDELSESFWDKVEDVQNDAYNAAAEAIDDARDYVIRYAVNTAKRTAIKWITDKINPFGIPRF